MSLQPVLEDPRPLTTQRTWWTRATAKSVGQRGPRERCFRASSPWAATSLLMRQQGPKLALACSQTLLQALRRCSLPKVALAPRKAALALQKRLSPRSLAHRRWRRIRTQMLLRGPCQPGRKPPTRLKPHATAQLATVRVLRVGIQEVSRLWSQQTLARPMPRALETETNWIQRQCTASAQQRIPQLPGPEQAGLVKMQVQTLPALVRIGERHPPCTGALLRSQ